MPIIDVYVDGKYSHTFECEGDFHKFDKEWRCLENPYCRQEEYGRLKFHIELPETVCYLCKATPLRDWEWLANIKKLDEFCQTKEEE